MILGVPAAYSLFSGTVSAYKHFLLFYSILHGNILSILLPTNVGVAQQNICLFWNFC